MDQQNTTPKHVPTAEEIARLEAEAVAALQRGEQPGHGEAPLHGETPAPADAPAARPDFVPYVDDVVDAPAPQPDAQVEPEGDDEDEEYIPGKWETWVNGLTEKQWRLTQMAGGAVVGLVALALLFIGGEELATYRLIVAALLALLAPRYLERVLRRNLVLARKAMVIALVVGLVVIFIVMGARNGFNFTK